MGKGSKEITELRRRASTLQKELKDVNDKLSELNDPDFKANGSSSSSSAVLPPPGKSGYLFKWQDRSIGWSGTKWALRFVKLDRGRISYYYSHLETSPRYQLSLRGCAIADEGWKRNRRHVSKTTPKGKDPPIEEVGAYFFVFSIYQRSDSSAESNMSNGNGNGSNGSPKINSNSNSEPSPEFVPLLRFSTPSLAEKNKWIELLSEACAYCETDAFLAEEATRNAEEDFRRQQQQDLAKAMPQAERGTLPPLYFATGPEKKRGLHQRRPSFSKIPKSNLFRTMSKSRDAEKAENKGFPPSKPMHRAAAPSVLSPEASSQNYRGFFNLGIIILIVSNFRLILAAVKKHGFVLAELEESTNYTFNAWDQFPVISALLVTQFFLAVAFITEYMLAKKGLYEPVGMMIHHINSHTSFATCIFIVWNFVDNPTHGGFLMLVGSITWMKLISYSLANQDYRDTKKRQKKEDSFQATLAIIDNLDHNDWNIEYPMNVTLGNLYYFWLSPSLTYQIAFPKTPRVRPLRVLGLFIRMVITFSLFVFLIYQIVSPNLENLLQDLEANGGRYTYAILADYWLKLTITNTYMWLMVFYFYFHLYLNFFAELLRFGDRVFYKDWWNSMEVSAYWRLWNLPVHYWLVRHLYFPCVRHNVPKSVATFVVFLFSAVMHEVIISIPFHMLRPWSFLGMMGQVPLVMLTKFLYRKFPGSSIGNILFWISFCVVGQPMAILLYTIDYYYGNMQHPTDLSFQDSPEVCTLKFMESCLIR